MKTLHLHNVGFSQVNARILCDASSAAYTQSNVHCSETDTHCFIFELSEAIVVAFQGTKDIRQWITDADFDYDHTPHGKVHAGFWEAWQSIRRAVVSKLLTLSQKPIFITGHSLGGALAELCAIDLQGGFTTLHSVYTFGQPRVGNKEFKRYAMRELSGMSFRVVNECDPVPFLPGLLIGYRHAGECVFLSSEGELVQPSVLVELLLDASGIEFELFHNRALPVISDHFIESYAAALKTGELPSTIRYIRKAVSLSA